MDHDFMIKYNLLIMFSSQHQSVEKNKDNDSPIKSLRFDRFSTGSAHAAIYLKPK